MDDCHKTDVSPNATTKSSAKKWLAICLGVAVVAFIAITFFKVSVSNILFIGALLLCPLMHFWMMKNGDHKH